MEKLIRSFRITQINACLMDFIRYFCHTFQLLGNHCVKNIFHAVLDLFIPVVQRNLFHFSKGFRESYTKFAQYTSKYYPKTCLFVNITTLIKCGNSHKYSTLSVTVRSNVIVNLKYPNYTIYSIDLLI